MNILSIQSSVAYGHVGNSAAVFPLQRMGFEVWPVNTVHFSNHTGCGEWRGSVLPADDVAGVVRGIEDRFVRRRSMRKACRLVPSLTRPTRPITYTTHGGSSYLGRFYKGVREAQASVCGSKVFWFW